MRYVKWTFLTLVALTLFSFFQYTLPQHDVVRIVGTYQERQDLTDWTRIFWATPDNQSTSLTNRDVQFIQTVRPNGDSMVYRNEDTGWSWPPYFKFDTANLQTEADDLKSTAEAPKWVSVTHYGWRNLLLSSFPNAIAITPVAGPDVSIFPWFNVIFLVVLAALLLLLWRMWAQFRERTIDPTLESISDTMNEVDARADGLRGRLMAWLRTWKGKPRR
tara:strand:- start:930 stop:1583 length:654 start_codon:yes stop_codon:yes gene_type:complete